LAQVLGVQRVRLTALPHELERDHAMRGAEEEGEGMIESLEQIRKHADMCTRMAGGEDGFETVWMTKRAFLDDLDAIEREVEERYIELPKDTNGVPIHLGDKVCTKLGSTYTVARITREDFEGTTTWYIEDFASHYSLGPEDLTICKPSTVEDLLRDFAYCCEEGATEQSIDEIIAEYAAKLQLKA